VAKRTSDRQKNPAQLTTKNNRFTALYTGLPG